ncbi:MAG TPA: hypothetical protein VGJ62_03055 [Gemmatimonadaceae bacterium]|jgi:hypothetical protein
MTAHQFAIAARADRKWILNSSALLGRRVRLSPAESRWWGLVRLLTESLGLPLQAAAEAATKSLETVLPAGRTAVMADPSDSATLMIDLPRYESVFLGNLSRALIQETPRRRGRRTSLRGGARAIDSARRYGVDLGLVQTALERTPAERLEMLEANAEFIRGMRKRET